MIKSIEDIDFEFNCEDFKYNYQEKLTEKLDKISTKFDQNTINEIVLWKLNRYAELSENSLNLINSISTTSNKINEELTKEVLTSLINQSGIQLPMASTILRFRNPKIYQIIDQRVYRILYKDILKLPLYNSDKNIAMQIEIYIKYLDKLRIVSDNLNIPFENADRILYELDKDEKMNKNIKLKNYGKE